MKKLRLTFAIACSIAAPALADDAICDYSSTILVDEVWHKFHLAGYMRGAELFCEIPTYKAVDETIRSATQPYAQRAVDEGDDAFVTLTILIGDEPACVAARAVAKEYFSGGAEL